MKAFIAQPLYSSDYADSDRLFEAELKMFDACDSSLDVIVFPEFCDCPALAKTKELTEKSYEKYNARLLQKASETAKRCGAHLFVNAAYVAADGKKYNATYAFDRSGKVAGRYFKRHLTRGEQYVKGFAADYTYRYAPPYTLILDGVKYAFLTCYDFYFYEAYPKIARERPDIIIGCSHQRSDEENALETITKFLAYHTNAYVLRSSVSMGENSKLGGCSMAVTPRGEILHNSYSKAEYFTVKFNVKDKYFKPAGYGNPPAAHFEYIEAGRRPYFYMPAGSMTIAPEAELAYPRVCAHRGFNTILPENSLAAYGAAVALGADEIEFDVWKTKDDVLVSCHDERLERTSDGAGKIGDYTYEEILKFDFGAKINESLAGMKIATFEEILKKFACTAIMNIHVKIWDAVKGSPEAGVPMLKEIVALIREYGCERHAYFMSGNENALAAAKNYAPEIAVCVGAGGEPYTIVDRAIKIGAKKVQLFKPYFTKEMIEKAHANGIKCNVFYADDPNEARRYLDMGVDTILTNDFLSIKQIVK